VLLLVAIVASLLTLTSAPAQAATTPVYVAGSAAAGFQGPYAGWQARTVTITSYNVQPGDLWVGIAAYHGDGGLAIAGEGWNQPSPYNAGGPRDIYGTRAWVFWKVLTAGDISGGTFTASVTTGADPAFFGGVRFSGVAYRGSNLTATVAGSAVSQGAAAFVSYADVTFPAVGVGSSTNVVLRMGAARGYGGYLAGQNIKWTSWPGTARVNASSGNTGDRALVISEQPNGNGAAASGRYYTALTGNRSRVTYSVVIRSQS
jgi:hypothetical protein